MDVDETEANAHQTVTIDEADYLVVFRHPRHRQGSEEGEHLRSVLDVPAGDFANDEGVTGDLSLLQQCFEIGVANVQV